MEQSDVLNSPSFSHGKNILCSKRIEATIFASQLYADDVPDFVRFKGLQRPAILIFVMYYLQYSMKKNIFRFSEQYFS